MFTRTGSCRALLSSDRDFRQRSPTHSWKTEHVAERKNFTRPHRHVSHWNVVAFVSVFSWAFSHYAERAEVIYQLLSSPADRSSSKHILHTHPNWLFLWRRCLLQICHLGQKCVTALSLVAQHRLKNITLKSPSVPPTFNIFRHTCAANQTEIESRHNSPIFHLQKSNVRFRH